MIKQDWLMSQIEIVARTLAKLIFNKDTPEYTVRDFQLLTETDIVCGALKDLISEGKINEAENLLFERIDQEIEEDPDGRQYLEVAIDFYSKLNELPPQTLEECGFEREEIDEGLREVAELYNINIIQ